MQATQLKVGELARRTGLSVRTLHHYDEIGLLSPVQRSESGYRLYGNDDVIRLQQIRSLRQLGFSLEDIRDLLDRPDISPLRVIELHLSRLKEQIALERKLEERLQALARRLAAMEHVSTAEFMQTIEVMSMVENIDMEKYYTPKQLAEIKERGARIGQERIREVEAEWPRLIAEVRAEMERGTDPTSEPVLVLARRWKALVDEFTGGNPEIERSLRTTYQSEPSAREYVGIDSELFGYVNKALAALNAE